MATIKFWQEMQRVVTIDGQDKLMIGKNSTGEAQYVNVEDLNQFLSIQGDSIPAITGGSTPATATALPTLGDENRYFDASWGYWKYNDVVLTNPNGVQGIPDGSEGVLFWNGTTQTWSISKIQELPQVDTSTLVSKAEFTDLETNLYGDTSIPVLTVVKKDVIVNPDVIGSVNTGGFLLGMVGYGQLYSPPMIPTGIYTCYVRLNVSNKGQLNSISYFNKTTPLGSVNASDINLNQDFEFVYPLVIDNDINSGVVTQIRTRYPLESTLPSSLTIKDWIIYKGDHTLQEIKDSSAPVDKSKVLKAKQADTATTAQTANTALVAQSLSGNYFIKISDYVSKVKNKWDAPQVVEWNSYTGSTTNYLTRLNSKLQVGGTVTNYTGSSGVHRLWFGIDVTPAVYASVSKTFYVVVKGVVTSNNIRNFIIRSAASRLSSIIAEDLTQGVPTPFQRVLEISYPVGSSTSDRYIMTDYTAYAGQTNIGLDVEFEVFSLFEKNATTDKFTIEDFIKASKDEYEVLNDSLLPDNVATIEYVDSEISNISKSSAKKLTDADLQRLLRNDVSMIVGYGQSNNTGAGATNSTTFFGNAISFTGGVSLASFTSEVPDTFFNNFIPLKDAPSSYSGTPITATVSTFMSILRDQNGIDLADYGTTLLPVTAGLSGGSIEVLKKGTLSYNNLLKSVTKGKSVSDSKGLTFGVPYLLWLQGEADRGQTKEWYYTRIKQLFIDLNTDIKAITGQVDDVIFFTWQVSPWAGRWYPSGSLTQQPGDLATGPQGIGVQMAQIQVANDMDNVFLSGAMFPYLFSDYFHLSDRALNGIQQGFALVKSFVYGEDVKTFQPISHKVISSGSNYFIQLKFDVPVMPARFDLGSDIWHNSNGKQPNYGFKVMSGSNNIISSEPFIAGGDTVVVPVNQNPIGATITYATDGHWGGGNLCDSQYGTVNIKNIDYKIDNYAVAFDNYLID